MILIVEYKFYLIYNYNSNDDIPMNCELVSLVCHTVEVVSVMLIDYNCDIIIRKSKNNKSIKSD